jgi:hypothetical protein
MKRLALVSITLVVAGVACGGGGENATQSPSPSRSVVRPASTAQLAILNPTPDQTVPTGGVTVKISLTGATIVKQTSTNLSPDKGHVHLLVDGTVVQYTGGLEIATGPLAKGPHLLQVEFVAVDHAPFNPRVIKQVTITAA